MPKFRKTFDVSPLLLSINSFKDARFIYVNRGFIEATGYTDQEVLGRTISELSMLRNDEITFFRNELRKHGSLHNMEGQFAKKNGDLRSALFSAEIVEFNDEKCVLVSMQDITERKITEAALRRESALFQGIYDTPEKSFSGVKRLEVAEKCLVVATGLTRSPLAFLCERVDHTRLEVAVSSGYGKTSEGIDMAQTLCDLNSGFLGGYLEKAPQSLILNDPALCTSRFLIPERCPSLSSFLGVPITIDNRATGFICLANAESGYSPDDVTDVEALSASLVDALHRIRVEEFLRRSEARYRTLLQSISDGVAILDREGRLAFVNEVIVERSGYAQAKLQGSCLFDLVDAEHREPTIERFTTALQGEWTQPIECSYTTAYGQKLWIEAHASPLYEGDRITGLIVTTRDTTWRKSAEEELKIRREHLETLVEERTKALEESERRYRDLVDNALVGIYQTTSAGKALYANETFLGILGFESVEEMNSKDWTSFFRDREKKEKFDRLLQDSGAVDRYGVELVTGEGRFIYLLLSATLRDDVISGIVLDITERIEAEEAVRESEKKYSRLFDSESDAIFLVDTKSGCILDANKASLPLFGYARNELLANTIFDLSTEPEETRKAVLDRKRTVPLRYLKKKDGSTFPAEIITTHFTRLGRPCHFVTVRDITERRQAEEALMESERKYRSLVENALVGVYITTIAGEILYANKPFLGILGFNSIEELRRAGAFLKYKSAGDEKRLIETLMKKGELSGYEVDLLKRTGEIVNAVLSVTKEGDILKGMLIDITARKKTESLLQASEIRYRTLFDHGNDAIFLVRERVIIECNERTLSMFRGLKQDITAKPWHALSPPVQPDGVKSSDKAEGFAELALSGIPQHFEWKYQRLDGELFDAEVSLNCVNLDAEELIQVEIRDITARKEAETNLRESNTALKVLLDQREKYRREIEEGIVANVKDLVLPYIENLRGTPLSPHQGSLLSLIRASLDEIVSPFLKNIRYHYSRFTPAEIKVAGFIRDGKSVKEIANLLGVSESSINAHRQHIRNKLGIRNEKINLRSFLLSLEGP